MAIICPSCGFSNEESIRFCVQCGTDLASADPGLASGMPEDINDEVPDEYAPPMDAQQAALEGASGFEPLPPMDEPPPAPSYSPPPPPAPSYIPAPPPPPAAGRAPYGAAAPKDKTIALLIELLPGLFGFLGIGWLYAGSVGTGIALLLGFIAWNFFAIILDAITFGLFACLHIPANLVIIGVSAYMLNNFVDKQNAGVY